MTQEMIDQMRDAHEHLTLLNRERMALQNEQTAILFMDDAARRLMPFTMQLATRSAPTLAGAAPKIDIDMQQAALIAYQAAQALFNVRCRVVEQILRQTATELGKTNKPKA